MFPVSGGDSLVHPVSEVIDEIGRSGLPYRVTAMDTVIEGEWDKVMPVIRRAHEIMSAKYDRVFMVATADDHIGRQGRLQESVLDVEAHLGHQVAH
ncbi:MAG: thiamine-binding protein [Gemmatimonadetes bacterium]|nr:thiamine-binding protein [Gemmatimonadota bacterium]